MKPQWALLLVVVLGALAALFILGRDAWGRDFHEISREPIGRVVPCAATPGGPYRGLCIEPVPSQGPTPVFTK